MVVEHVPLLSLRNLSAWYVPGRPVLSGVSLDLAAHEVVGLLGRNGAGKTTLFQTLAGLLPGCCLDRAAWQGREIAFRDEGFKRNRYLVFAEENAFSYFTFRDYLAYAADAYGVPVPEVSALVEGFRFGTCTQVLFRELSTGNRKKAALITAFALRPKLLLLDEPVNGLDFQSTEFLYQLIGSYRQVGTLLFSSHVLESLCLTADRVLVLEGGRFRRTFSGGELNAGTIREVLYREEDGQSPGQRILWPEV